MIVGKDNRGGSGNVTGTYEMTAEKQPEGCPGFYFEVELMPGAQIDQYSCIGISRWNNGINTRYLGGNYSYQIRLNDGYKYPNSGG